MDLILIVISTIIGAITIILLIKFLFYKCEQGYLPESEYPESEYMDWDLASFESPDIHKNVSNYVKIADISEMEDLAKINDELSKGNVVIVNNNSIFVDKKNQQQIIQELQRITNDIHGNISPIDQNRFIITPQSIKIERRIPNTTIPLESNFEDENQDISTDYVHFSATSPAIVTKGTKFIFTIWTHLDSYRDEIKKRFKEAGGVDDIHTYSVGPRRIPRGVELVICLSIDKLDIPNNNEIIYWDGKIASVSFHVQVPNSVEIGKKSGIAKIYLNNLQIAKILFEINVGDTKSYITEIPIEEIKYRKAFISYASEDRNEVLKRLQGMQKMDGRYEAEILRPFMDFISIRSGQYWKIECKNAIQSCDIFYLFWSKNAAKSEWVEKEWRYALKTKGIDFIDPVPLVSPLEIPPPQELSEKQFHDWVLGFIQETNRNPNVESTSGGLIDDLK